MLIFGGEYVCIPCIGEKRLDLDMRLSSRRRKSFVLRRVVFVWVRAGAVVGPGR